MDIELLVLNGYGQFVWPAFIFTFISCFFLYLKTKREFQEQEKIYLKIFKQEQTIKVTAFKKRENTKEALSGNSI